jgi:hypothetical protein
LAIIERVTNASDEVSIRACSASDREEQARLFNACFKKQLGAAELAWRYDQGPHGGSLSFVTRDTNGQPLSGYACNPRRVVSRGRHATVVGETGDVMTHPSARGRGLFSDLDRACMRATADAQWTGVFGLPNRKSAPIFAGKLGWNVVGRIRPHTFLLKGGSAVRELRSREGRLCGLMSGVHTRRCARALQRLEQSGRAVAVEAAPRAPMDVDALWASVAADFDWMVCRDAAYLDWRFVRNPSGLHRLFAARSGAELEGYVVIQLPRPGATLGYLVDLVAPEPAVRAALIARALRELESAGAAAVEATAVDGGWWQGVLTGAGFLPPREENHMIVISYLHDRHHPVARAMLDARTWYLTDGDRDDATMG